MDISKNFFRKLKNASENVTDFKSQSFQIEESVSKVDKREIVQLVELVGAIPESIQPSSSEEKLFAKAGDIISARALEFLGLKAKSLDGRGNSGDVIATSIKYKYSLIGDAKSFRLSRTAKNQKDYKVKALSQWREDNDYAVLIAPLFQYPSSTSQIFSQSLTENVLLFSWEHLAILLKLGIVESPTKTFEQLWNFPQKYRKKVVVEDMNKNFFKDFNAYFIDEFGIPKETLSDLLEEEIASISKRASLEKQFWQDRAKEIKQYSKQEAIDELLKQMNINSKMKVIDSYVGGLRNAKTRYTDQ